jgi:hypothetical protein
MTTAELFAFALMMLLFPAVAGTVMSLIDWALEHWYKGVRK